MKRTIFRISLVMLLGVVTSVAVAWGCAWRFQEPQFYGLEGLDKPIAYYETSWTPNEKHLDDTVTFREDSGFGTHKLFVFLRNTPYQSLRHQLPPSERSRSIPRWLRARILHSQVWQAEPSTMDDWPDSVDSFSVLDAGWPFLLARCEPAYFSMHFGESSIEQGPKVKAIGGFAIEDESGRLRTVPFHPIWPGLLANTAIYGGVWSAILFGPGMLIRWRRRRAGRCTKCGYDLRGLSPTAGSDSVCPECGHAE